MSHTPSPWVLSPKGYDGRMNEFNDHDCTIQFEGAQIAVLGLTATKDENEANARLIAAAPDLYEALQRCLHAMNYAYSGAPNFAVVEKMLARNALEKAGRRTS